MLSLMLFQRLHYGFLGIEGLVGIVIGAVILLFICLILYKIVFLIAAKLGADATTQAIVYWCFVLVVFILFLHLFGLY
jgi:hypothetical protein